MYIEGLEKDTFIGNLLRKYPLNVHHTNQTANYFKPRESDAFIKKGHLNIISWNPEDSSYFIYDIILTEINLHIEWCSSKMIKGVLEDLIERESSFDETADLSSMKMERAYILTKFYYVNVCCKIDGCMVGFDKPYLVFRSPNADISLCDIYHIPCQGKARKVLEAIVELGDTFPILRENISL